MRRVLKYALFFGETAVPAGPVRAIGRQYGEIFAWIEVECPEGEKPMLSNSIICVATGATIPSHAGEHLGSTVSDQLVWHFYQGPTA